MLLLRAMGNYLVESTQKGAIDWLKNRQVTLTNLFSYICQNTTTNEENCNSNDNGVKALTQTSALSFLQ